MFRITLLAALAAVSFAQDAPRPPAAVDKALRARVKEFYQYHVTEEYRKAEKLVAEDSQDIYYVASKPHYLSFEIQGIQYSDHFKKAKVTVMCEQFSKMPGVVGKPMKMPSTSNWKVVGGKWFWYVDKEDLSHTMFGKSANAGTKGTGAQAPDISKPVDLGGIRADKESVDAKPNTTQQVTITNGTEGSISLVLHQNLPGWQVTFEKANLNAGEKTVATFKSGDNPHGGEIQIMVHPFGQIITVQSKR
jgi:hypothetical protein